MLVEILNYESMKSGGALTLHLKFRKAYIILYYRAKSDPIRFNSEHFSKPKAFNALARKLIKYLSLYQI
jgi:hypothetical protein